MSAHTGTRPPDCNWKRLAESGRTCEPNGLTSSPDDRGREVNDQNKNSHQVIQVTDSHRS